METEPENPRLQTVSDLLLPFVGPLPKHSHCHICLDPWYSTPSSNQEDDITCSEPSVINHTNCQCRNIVIGKSCVSQWLLEKDTCPMCRKDVLGELPPHLRNRPPPVAYDNEASDNEEAGIPADFVDEEYTEDNGLEDQSWLYSGGNYIHPTTISTGEHFSTADIVELFINKRKIETFKTEVEAIEWYTKSEAHSPAVWERGYDELVRGRSQMIEDLFTVHGPIYFEGIPVDEWD